MSDVKGAVGVDIERDRQFEEHRPLLFGIAYRMLGSVAESEDVVQDTWLRWHRADRSEVRSPRSYLAATASRLAIDRLRSARHRREAYVGPWLPEPLPTDPVPAEGDDPAEVVELTDSVTTAFLVMLERLDPVHRAVLLLRDVFGFPYEEVAAVVNRSPEHCRQILRRAQSRVRGSTPAAPVEGTDEELLAAFLQAAAEGDVQTLVDLLADDVVHMSDGGGVVRAARRPVVGKDRVARLFVNLAARMGAGVSTELRRLNGRPSAVVWRPEGDPLTALSIDVDGGRIVRIWVVANPEKLAHLHPLPDDR